jgi:hypothetical protein
MIEFIIGLTIILLVIVVPYYVGKFLFYEDDKNIEHIGLWFIGLIILALFTACIIVLYLFTTGVFLPLIQTIKIYLGL